MQHGDLYAKLNATESEYILSGRNNAIAFEDGDVINVDLTNLGFLREGFATLVNTGDNEYRFTTTATFSSSYARLKALLDVYEDNPLRSKNVVHDQANYTYDQLPVEKAEVLEKLVSTLGLKDIKVGDSFSLTIYRKEDQVSVSPVTVEQIEKAFGVEDEKYRHIWYIVPLNSGKIEAYNLSALYCYNFINTIDLENELKLRHDESTRKSFRRPIKYVSEPTPPLASKEVALIDDEKDLHTPERRTSSLIGFLAEVLEDHSPKIKFTRRGMKNAKTDHRRRD